MITSFELGINSNKRIAVTGPPLFE